MRTELGHIIIASSVSRLSGDLIQYSYRLELRVAAGTTVSSASNQKRARFCENVTETYSTTHS
jgi:hypothetical protein